jgi:enoyl-CoA hydratase
VPSRGSRASGTCRAVDAEEALRLGLALGVTGDGECVAAARELAAAICENSPFGTRLTKSLLALSMDGASLDQMVELENRSQILGSQTADFDEAVRAFLEKRPPAYADR